MDQIRKALAWLKRYHFWVLSVLVALVAMLCWYSAAGTLTKEYTANKSVITAEFNNQQTLQGQPFKPNDKVNEGQSKEIEKQAKNVEAIWKQLWDRQREGVLVWPESLSPAFRDYVSKLKFGDEIPGNLRDNYRDYIDRHFESLPKKVGARVMEASEGGGGFEGSRGFMSRGRSAFDMRGEGGEGMPRTNMVAEEDYICEWLDQGMVRQELTFLERPSALKIWVTQENLWVYHTLLNIIANTNQKAGADRMSNAAIRTIVTLEVGAPAAQAARASGRIEIKAPPAAGGAEGEFAGEGGEVTGEAPIDGGRANFGREGGGAYSRGGMDGAPMSPEQEKAELLSFRYLDATGVAAGVGGGGAEDGSVAPDPAAGEGVDTSGPFKRLPIRMTLEMDQRWLPFLISQCASQPLQVEVTEVRINPSDVTGSSGGGGFGGGEGGFRGGRGGGGSSMGGSSLVPRQPGEIRAFKQNPYLATVVIQGIIYIFNEPDPSLLQPPSDQVAVIQQ